MKKIILSLICIACSQYLFCYYCAKDGMHTLNYVLMPDSSYLCVVDGTIDEEPKPWKWSWNNVPTFHWFWNQVD